MTTQKYVVRIVRPVFQAAYIEVDGKDEAEAIYKASEAADHLPEEEWKGRFNPEEYWYDIDCVRSGETPEGNAFTLLDFPFYAILSSKEEPTMEPAISQPWMECVSPFTMAALFSQWGSQLRDERGAQYEQAILETEEILKKLKGTDQKVVALKPPEERRFNVELAEAALECLKLLNEVD